jgi:hypothetical protein
MLLASYSDAQHVVVLEAVASDGLLRQHFPDVYTDGLLRRRSRSRSRSRSRFEFGRRTG